MNSESMDTAQVAAPELASNVNNQMSEPVVPQSKVNDIVKARAADAYERGRQEAMQALQAQQAQQPAQNFLTEDKLNEKLKHLQDQYIVNQMLANHQRTIETGRQEYSDFDEVTSSIDLMASPQWIPLLNSVPNAKDVYYELGKDDRRFIDIHSALATGQTKKAEKMLRALSESVEMNKQSKQKAQSAVTAPAPLSKVKPSTATADAGQMSFADMKAAVRKNMR